MAHTWANSKSFADPLDGLHPKEINKQLELLTDLNMILKGLQP